MSLPCPFCDYAGPSPILADHGDVFVIEPISPVVDGHLLVIPREHVTHAKTDPKLTGRVFEVAALESRTRVMGPCNLITSVGREATQSVLHLHVHIVPRRYDDGLALPWSGRDSSS